MTALDEIASHGSGLVLLARCSAELNPAAADAVTVELSKRFGNVVMQRDSLRSIVDTLTTMFRQMGHNRLAGEITAWRDAAMSEGIGIPGPGSHGVQPSTPARGDTPGGSIASD